MKKFYKGKKILVTGATGFKGAWLCYWLCLLGAKVYGIGYNPNKNKNLFYSLGLDKKINLKLLDIRDKKKLTTVLFLFKPQIIFHLAAQPLILESYKKPYLTHTVNILGTLNILEISRQLNSVKSIVCVTSDKCYASNFSTRGFKEDDKLGGVDPYSGSKASAEIIINSYYKSFFINKTCGLASARAGNVIGGGDWSENRLIPDVINSLHKNRIINIRNPKFNRPWQHVLEPLNGYLILAKKIFNNPKKYSGPWNFGTRKNTITDVLTVVKHIVKKWGSGKIKFKRNQKYYEQVNLQLNIEKSIRILKWKPNYSIFKSIRITTEWYKSVLKKKINPKEITKNQIIDFMNDYKKN
jgi:CDP-glucose 4,6-dehydratase